MGCDIHLYVEYRAKDRAANPDPFMRRFSSFGSRINPGRIYEVFAAIAVGVMRAIDQRRERRDHFGDIAKMVGLNRFVSDQERADAEKHTK